MKRVFGYLRVSGVAQIDGGGFERQQQVIEAFCASKDWRPVFRKEQQSGADEYLDRKVMADMVDVCSPDGHGVNIIVVENATRIARDMMIQELFIRDCLRKKIQVFSAEGGEELTNPSNDPTRTLIRQILGALSQWEKATITKRLQAGRRRVARQTGKPCGGPPRFNENPDNRWLLRHIKELREVYKLSWGALATQGRRYNWPKFKQGSVWQRSTVKFIYEKYCKDKNP